MRERGQIEITKIQAKQAVIVAVITAISSIAVTLLAAKSMERPSALPISVTMEGQSSIGVAPLIFVASANPELSGPTADQCKAKANVEMTARRGKVVAIGKSWIALEWRDFGIMVMCQGEGHGASVIVAGSDSKANSDLAISLRAAVLEWRQ